MSSVADYLSAVSTVHRFAGGSPLPIVEINGVGCTSIAVPIAHTQITCLAPTGRGISLPVRVSIAGQNATAASTLSYDAALVDVNGISPVTSTVLTSGLDGTLCAYDNKARRNC